MRRSAAIGVSRVTGMNSEATSANTDSVIAKTPPQNTGRVPDSRGELTSPGASHNEGSHMLAAMFMPEIFVIS